VTVTVTLHCGGCEVEAPGLDYLKTGFISLSGQDHGLGGMDLDRLVESLLAQTPEGWIMFDPWTYCTYCPTCWASIIAVDPADSAGPLSP
jgi:hypothetical protein